MTNHPHRAHDDEEPSAAATGELAAEVPAVKELADEMAAQPAQQVPPGFSPNGHPTPAAQALQALTAALEQLPQMLFQAVAMALQQVPVQVTVKPGPCGTCFTARAGWFAAHAADLAKAEAAYNAAVSELPEGDPRRGLIRGVSFLPAALQPSPDPSQPNPQAIPDLAEGAVMIGGTWYCPAHVPGVAVQPGRKEFLIANGPLSGALIAEIMQGRAA